MRLVAQVEPFGVFVRLAGSRLTGLAHITELADGFVADVEEAFPVGQGASWLRTHSTRSHKRCLWRPHHNACQDRLRVLLNARAT